MTLVPRLALALAAVVWLGASAVAGSDAQRWWSHVKFLADDSLQGRDTGSAGHRKAAEYVAAHFAREGLKPGGVNGYFQPVALRSRRVVEERSSLALKRNGATEPIVLGAEATLSMRIEHAAALEAPLVFAGYGLTIPEAQHDDLRGLDLRGKVAVYLTGGPARVPGPLLAHYQSTGERWRALRQAGAVGTIAIQNPRGADIPWERSMLSRFMPAMTLADPALDETAGQKLAVTFNPAHAEKLFAGSGRTFQEVLARSQADEPLPRFPLAGTIGAKVAFEARAVESDNVVGILPGADPEVRDEYVVFSAHLDHVGVGRAAAPGADAIYNGAMDNASGTATLLEMATMARMAGERFRRPVILLAVTAEEKGLLGSRYFAHRPSLGEAAKLVANVNTDMFLPLFPMKTVIVQGLDESDLGRVVREVAAARKVEAIADPEPERNAFTRSDQYSFIKRGVPALSLKVGFRRDSPEWEVVRKWRAERYHAPSDDLAQPVDLAAAAAFNDLMLALTRAIANLDAPPRWREDSFFRRFDKRDE